MSELLVGFAAGLAVAAVLAICILEIGRWR